MTDSSVPAWKIISILAWPAVVEQLLQTAVNYVDTAMVGSLGVDSTAAIGAASSTVWLVFGLMNAVGAGFSVLMARRIGEKRLEEARAVIRQVVLAVVVLGLACTLMMVFLIAPNLPIWLGVAPAVAELSSTYLRIYGCSYLFNFSAVVCSNLLRCAGDTKTPMRFNLITNVINVVGNFMLIYPTKEYTILSHTFVLHRAGLGVAGAALASSAAIVCSGSAMLISLFLWNTPTRISLRESYRPDPAVIRSAVRLGAPTAAERVTISLGHILSTAMITSLGTTALAAHQLASTGESFCYLPAGGFAIAGTTLVAQCLGAGDQRRTFLCAQWAVRLAVLVMCLSSLAMFLGASPIIDFFSDDPDAIALGARMLRIEAVAEPFMAVGIVMSGVLRGAGDVRWPVYMSVLGVWCVRIPVAFLLLYVFHWDLSGIWTAMIADWVVRAAFFLNRFYKKRWLTAWK